MNSPRGTATATKMVRQNDNHQPGEMAVGIDYNLTLENGKKSDCRECKRLTTSIQKGIDELKIEAIGRLRQLSEDNQVADDAVKEIIRKIRSSDQGRLSATHLTSSVRDGELYLGKILGSGSEKDQIVSFRAVARLNAQRLEQEGSQTNPTHVMQTARDLSVVDDISKKKFAPKLEKIDAQFVELSKALEQKEVAKHNHSQTAAPEEDTRTVAANGKSAHATSEAEDVRPELAKLHVGQQIDQKTRELLIKHFGEAFAKQFDKVDEAIAYRYFSGEKAKAESKVSENAAALRDINKYPNGSQEREKMNTENTHLAADIEKYKEIMNQLEAELRAA